MNQLAFIRRDILKVTQTEMAWLTGVRQATVSRWESGELEPSLEQMQRIRAEALRRGVPWDDRWFFDAGTTDPAATSPKRKAIQT